MLLKCWHEDQRISANSLDTSVFVEKALTKRNGIGVSFVAGNETRGLAKSTEKRTALNRDSRQGSAQVFC